MPIVLVSRLGFGTAIAAGKIRATRFSARRLRVGFGTRIAPRGRRGDCAALPVGARSAARRRRRGLASAVRKPVVGCYAESAVLAGEWGARRADSLMTA